MQRQTDYSIMKIHLPPTLLRKLLAVVFFTMSTSQLAQANIVEKEWESGSQIAESKKVTVISVDSSYLPDPTSIADVDYLTLASGVTPLFYTGATHINSQGELLDSSGNTITDPDTGLTVGLGTAVTTTENIVSTWYGDVRTLKAGSIVLGTRTEGTGDTAATTYEESFYVSDYEQFNSGKSTQLYTDEFTKIDNFYMGKTNESWGSVDDEVSTTLIIGAGSTGADVVVGGNLITAAATAQADFVGSSTIIFKEGSALGMGFIVGANHVEEDATYGGDFTGNVQISLQSDSVQATTVTGGNYNHENENSTFGANGESSVEIYLRDGASAEQIVGGNSGYAGSFKGNVDIQADGKIDSIIGAGYMAQSGNAKFEGNTNIKITIATDSGRDYLYGNYFSAEQGITGGFASNTDVSYSVKDIPGVHPANSSFPTINFEGKTATITGQTKVEIDLGLDPSSYGNDKFIKAIVAGSLIGNGLVLTHEGGSELTITNASDTQFSRWVVGGNLVTDVTDGDYYDFWGEPFPYMDRTVMASATIDSVVVNVDSGLFYDHMSNDSYGIANLFTVGSMSAGGGNVTTGSTQANITGGNFQTIIGGNTSEISDQQFDGSYFKDTTSGATKVGNVALNVSGEASSSMIVGGSYLSDNITGVTGLDPETGKSGAHIVHAAEVGDVTVDVTGGYHGDITSGSYIGQNIAMSEAAGEGYLITQGNLSLRVTGNSEIYGGIISGAGIIKGAGSTRTNSSEELSSAVANYYLDDFFDRTGGLVTNEELFQVKPSAYAGSMPEGDVTDASLSVRVETESTKLEIGSEVTFTEPTTITGGYGGIPIPDAGETPQAVYDAYWEFEYWLSEFEPGGYDPNEEMYAWAQSWMDALNADLERAKLTSDGVNYQADAAVVKGNRQLVFNDKTKYENLANAKFVEFDEVHTGAGTTVDFTQNNQDLDLLAGRHNIAADGIHVVEGDYTGTNTVRKTGEGTLMLSDTNGQENKATADAASNLQLVVEAGTVVLAKESAATNKSDFKTFVVQSGATLDMRAGNYDAATGKYISGNAGINGDLRLEVSTILLVDASRDIMGSGTALEGGSLQIIGEGQVTLQFDNLDLIERNQVAEAGHLIFEAGAMYFEIVLFSELDYGLTSSTNLFFSETGGTFDGVDAKGVLASKYFNSNLDLTNVYLVYNANGDIVLTGSTIPAIPEPSTATLSLLALAGLLARRRRKAI